MPKIGSKTTFLIKKQPNSSWVFLKRKKKLQLLAQSVKHVR